METKNMIYLVSEYASQGEIFGKCVFLFCFVTPSSVSTYFIILYPVELSTHAAEDLGALTSLRASVLRGGGGAGGLKYIYIYSICSIVASTHNKEPLDPGPFSQRLWTGFLHPFLISPVKAFDQFIPEYYNNNNFVDMKICNYLAI